MSTLEAFIKSAEVQFDISNNATIVQYPYRTMLLGPGQFLEMQRSELREFEQELAAASGKSADNHVVYGITEEGSPTLYVRFHDEEVIFGLTIRPHH